MIKLTKNGKPTKAPYETGFGKPPKAHQFKPGQSGNPSGRPKGKPTTTELFQRTAHELVSVRQGDKTVRIAKVEVVIRRLFQKAMEGDTAAQKLVLAAAAHEPTSDDTTLAVGNDDINLDDDALERMLARFDHLRSRKTIK